MGWLGWWPVLVIWTAALALAGEFAHRSRVIRISEHGERSACPNDGHQCVQDEI